MIWLICIFTVLGYLLVGFLGSMIFMADQIRKHEENPKFGESPWGMVMFNTFCWPLYVFLVLAIPVIIGFILKELIVFHKVDFDKLFQ